MRRPGLGGEVPVSYAYRWSGAAPPASRSRRDHKQLPGGRGRRRRDAPGRRLRLQQRGSSEAASAQTAAVIAAGETTLTFNVSANADDGDVTVSGSAGSGYPRPARRRRTRADRCSPRGGGVRSATPRSWCRCCASTPPPSPTNTVTSAKLRLHVTGKADDDNRSLVGEWYPSSNWPIDPTDWTQTTGTSAL